MFKVKQIRASVRELHHKSVRRAADERTALAEWRSVRTEETHDAWHQARRTARERGQCHRMWILLAAFVRGIPYKRIEPKTHEAPPSTGSLTRLLICEASDVPLPPDTTDTAFWRDVYRSPDYQAIAAAVEPQIEAWLAGGEGLRQAA